MAAGHAREIAFSWSFLVNLIFKMVARFKRGFVFCKISVVRNSFWSSRLHAIVHVCGVVPRSPLSLWSWAPVVPGVLLLYGVVGEGRLPLPTTPLCRTA